MISATRRNFGERHLIELGVGCEACHGGAREHVAEPKRRPSFALKSELRLRARLRAAPTRRDAQDVNRTCARCHTVLVHALPATPGKASGDAIETRAAATSTPAKLATSCSAAARRSYTARAATNPTARARVAPGAEPRRCQLCAAATRLRRARASRAHTHHAAGSPGQPLRQLPHADGKTWASRYDLVRYHRIGSPTDRERVEGDRPLECALCHADQERANRW